MPFKIEPVTDADFDAMAALKYHDGGDLSSPATPAIWTTSDDAAEMAGRTRWSVKQQREMFHDDPSTRFMKVVDTDKDNAIVSIARWHYYPNGYQYKETFAWELNGKGPYADKEWPDKINVPLAKMVLDDIFRQRAEWMGQRPMWVLTTLKTKESEQKRGAGSMLVKWGIEQARKDGVPAFLEASKEGQPMYEKAGFVKLGEVSTDLSSIGIPHSIVNSKMMANGDSVASK